MHLLSNPFFMKYIQAKPVDSFLIVLFALLLIQGCVNNSDSESTFNGGNGTEANPYQISTIEQLQAIAEEQNLDKHFIQVGDIDASPSAEFESNTALQKGFSPIGDANLPFTGSYNGNGYVIDNLYLKFTRSYDYNGMFGYIRNAKLENIYVNNYQQFSKKLKVKQHNNQYSQSVTVSSYLYQSNRNIITRGLAGLVGVNEGGEIRNCHFRGGVSGYLGQGGAGFTGVNTGLIEYSSFEGIVSYDGSYGFVGLNTGEIRDSHAVVNAGGQSSTGFAGSNEGLIIRSYTDVVLSSDKVVAGFVFFNKGRIEMSFATGTASGIMRSAGFAIENSGTILDSYTWIEMNVRHVIGFDELHVSPLVLENQADGIIKTSYSGASLKIDNEKAAVFSAGVAVENNGALHSVYWNRLASGLSKGVNVGDENGVKGLITSEMTGPAAETYMPEFDWNTVWRTTEGYPVLRWQGEE